jgi:hypothetical protein
MKKLMLLMICATLSGCVAERYDRYDARYDYDSGAPGYPDFRNHRNRDAAHWNYSYDRWDHNRDIDHDGRDWDRDGRDRDRYRYRY